MKDVEDLALIGDAVTWRDSLGMRWNGFVIDLHHNVGLIAVVAHYAVYLVPRHRLEVVERQAMLAPFRNRAALPENVA